MPLKSDLQLDAAKFAPSAISQKTSDFNDKLIKIMEGGPRWYEVMMLHPKKNPGSNIYNGNPLLQGP